MNQIEKVARALAKADGLDFDEVCGVDANPDDGYCDSGTCVAAHWEEHDAEQARRWYMHLAKAAIAAMPVQAEPQWQGIESAPRDGTRMILAKFVGHPAHDTALWWAVAGHWSDKWQNWNDGVEPCGLAGPTHWMPLPTPPAGGSDEVR